MELPYSQQQQQSKREHTKLGADIDARRSDSRLERQSQRQMDDIGRIINSVFTFNFTGLQVGRLLHPLPPTSVDCMISATAAFKNQHLVMTDRLTFSTLEGGNVMQCHAIHMDAQCRPSVKHVVSVESTHMYRLDYLGSIPTLVP